MAVLEEIILGLLENSSEEPSLTQATDSNLNAIQILPNFEKNPRSECGGKLEGARENEVQLRMKI